VRIIAALQSVVSNDNAGVLFGSIIQPSDRSRIYGLVRDSIY
jgi:hypothetical protein